MEETTAAVLFMHVLLAHRIFLGIFPFCTTPSLVCSTLG